jgi:hypothetical protein
MATNLLLGRQQHTSAAYGRRARVGRRCQTHLSSGLPPLPTHGHEKIPASQTSALT